MKRLLLAACAVRAVFACDLLQADSIATLYNTGTTDAGTPLQEGAIDPHYTLTQFPAASGAGSNTYVATSVGDWIPNSSASQWISLQADQNTMMNDAVAGNYSFRTTFDLTGFDPASATISGRWSVDDFGLDILVNGISTGLKHDDLVNGDRVQPYSFQFFSDFSISSGFVAGLNTLDFLVLSPPLDFNPSINPMGLRVELSGTANPVPEPPTLALAALGTLGLLACVRTIRQGQLHYVHPRDATDDGGKVMLQYDAAANRTA